MRTQTLSTLAASAPTSRLRYLDAFRAAAILLVIIGHWLVMTVANVDGELLGFTALPRIDRLWPLTWVFQVMPLFFLVGGVASGIAWTRARDRGSTASAWLLGRQRRLMTPALVVLGLAVVGALLARGLGAPEGLVIQAVDAVTLPMWFLVIYLALMLATPLLYLLFERFGHLVFLVMVMLVILSDTLRILTGNIYLGYLNYGLVWVIPYQVGFAWQRGTLRLTWGRAWALLGGSLLVLVLLTYVGPYPISMINIDSSLLNNTSPPTIALLVLAFAQIAGAWLLSGPVQRWLERSRWWWRAVVAINAVTLTLFLWHMVAALTAALVLNAMGRLPWWFTGTGWGDPRWWQGRLSWFLAITPLLLLFVLAFGWVETRPVRNAAHAGGDRATTNHRLEASHSVEPPPARVGDVVPVSSSTTTGQYPRPPNPVPSPTSGVETSGMLAVTAVSYSLVVGGLLWMASAPSGFHGPAVIPTGALLLVATGSILRMWATHAIARSRPAAGGNPWQPG